MCTVHTFMRSIITYVHSLRLYGYHMLFPSLLVCSQQCPVGTARMGSCLGLWICWREHLFPQLCRWAAYVCPRPHHHYRLCACWDTYIRTTIQYVFPYTVLFTSALVSWKTERTMGCLWMNGRVMYDLPMCYHLPTCYILAMYIQCAHHDCRSLCGLSAIHSFIYVCTSHCYANEHTHTYLYVRTWPSSPLQALCWVSYL